MKMPSQIYERVRGFYTRRATRFLFRRPFPLKSGTPVISFTFDDFPRSALLTGGAILKRYGLTGTYYAAFGLMGKSAPTGSMFLREDLDLLFEQGHELGCHTFNHCHALDTKTGLFEAAILKNRATLQGLFPGASLRTLSYPISPPRPRTKQRMARHFVCCRGGGQTFNSGTLDLNYLSAYFLEKSRSDPDAVKSVIDQNRLASGWLILATHDVCESPTNWGCRPDFFEDIVQYAVSSGARVLPVYQAFQTLCGPVSGEAGK
jgi:peptidoglycan/xylan/chitin deacetylase (PgdA/CDA1 family)